MIVHKGNIFLNIESIKRVKTKWFQCFKLMYVTALG